MWKLMEKPAAFSLVYALPQTRTVQHIRIRVLYSTTPVPDQTSAAATMIGTGIRIFLRKVFERKQQRLTIHICRALPWGTRDLFC